MNEVESSWLGKEQQNSTDFGKLEQCQIFKSFFYHVFTEKFLSHAPDWAMLHAASLSYEDFANN